MVVAHFGGTLRQGIHTPWMTQKRSTDSTRLLPENGVLPASTVRWLTGCELPAASGSNAAAIPAVQLRSIQWVRSAKTGPALLRPEADVADNRESRYQSTASRPVSTGGACEGGVGSPILESHGSSLDRRIFTIVGNEFHVSSEVEAGSDLAAPLLALARRPRVCSLAA